MRTTPRFPGRRADALRAAAPLRTFSKAEPEAIRIQCMRALAAASDSDVVLFYRAGVVADEIAMGGVLAQVNNGRGRDSARLTQHLREPEVLERWAVAARETWSRDPRRLAYATTINRWDGRFVEDAQFATPEEWSTIPSVRFALAVLGDSQIRMAAHAGRVFIGWIGVFRRHGQPRFEAEERQALEPLQEAFKAGLAMAARLEDGGQRGPSGDLVVSPGGRILFASPQLATWLETTRLRERVREAVRAWDTRPEDAVAWDWCMGNLRFRGLRLDAGKVGYVIHAEPIKPILVPAGALLTARQWAVAHAIAGGQASRAAARCLGMSVHTVRTHLKAAHATLGVSNRAELAAAIHASGREDSPE